MHSLSGRAARGTGVRRAVWLLAMMLLALLASARVRALPLASSAIRAARPTVSLQPATPSLVLGQSTDVNVGIEDVYKILSAQYTITFDPNVLQVVDADLVTPGVQIDEATIFGSSGHTQVNAVNNISGTIQYTALWIASSPGAKPVSGSGSLGSIEFRAVGEGTSALPFADIGTESIIIVEWPDGTPAPITCDWEPTSLTVSSGYSMFLPLVCKGW